MCLGQAVEDGPPTWETCLKLWVPGFDVAQPKVIEAIWGGNQQISVSIHLSAFQINKQNSEQTSEQMHQDLLNGT